MTRKSKRELERAVEDLDGGGDDDGFLCVRIGGDPDTPEGGFYAWESERGAYVNDTGHEIPPGDAPDGDGWECNIQGVADT